MSVHVKIAGGLLAVGILTVVGWKFVEPYLAQRDQVGVSDASGKKGNISIAVDGWVGYFPLCSPKIKKQMHVAGYGLRCIDDSANYDERFKKLKSGEYAFAVATVDSYLLVGEKYDFPGPIVAVIDESKGGDALVARKAKFPSLDSVKNAATAPIAYTPDSPSHHLLKAIAVHFEMPHLVEKRNRRATNGSEQALDLLRKGQVDLAVLWQPDVTKALESEEYVRLLGTEDTRQLIVDILIASKSVVKDQPELIQTLLKEYFKTLKFYRDNPAVFLADISEHYNVKKTVAQSLSDGVAWATLNENADTWFSVSGQAFTEEALVQSIEGAVEILRESKDFTRHPIPDEDVYRILNSQFVKDLWRIYANTGFTSPTGATTANRQVFSPLSPEQWNQLGAVGSLKTRNISFSSGTSDLTLDGKEQVDQLMFDLKHYPAFRLEIRGHTGLRGDAQANIALSQARSESVLRYMQITHDLEDNRARAVGFGATKPLIRRSGESSRSYNYRLPRVEIALVKEVL